VCSGRAAAHLGEYLTYTQHPVTPELLARLWANLWERGHEEFRRNGLTLQQAFGLFLHHSQVGDSGILCADGQPVLVAGVFQNGPEVTTFMEATQDFERHYRQIVRVIRSFVRKREGDIFIYSVTVHPKSARFFRALGFVPDVWQGQTPTGATLYRFKRVNHVS
jgi:hypothetical protein